MNTFKPHTNGYLPPAGVAPADIIEFYYEDTVPNGEMPLQGRAEIVPWKMVKHWRFAYPRKEAGPLGHNAHEMSGGGKLTGAHYYRVAIPEPMSSELAPYVAECADIIEALGMTFNEGEAFKAIWRLAAGRTLGLRKNNPQYDADKAAHYAERLRVVYSRSTSTN